MTAPVFYDEVPPKKSGAPRKYAALYEPAQANPGKWCVWIRGAAVSRSKDLVQAYPGMQFVCRDTAGNRATIWGCYRGEGVS